MNWSRRPIIYEINTTVWLNELTRDYHQRINLSNVPSKVWDAIAEWPLDAVWLMGVWQRSPLGQAIALDHPDLAQEFVITLPDFVPEDNVGSAYCIRDYRVDEALGGEVGLSIARQALADRGIRLILDFVPNHCAQDHPWVGANPDYFIQAKQQDYVDHPSAYFQSGEYFIARGRDPHSPAWPDVAQLNLFSRGLRDALIQTLQTISKQCDGLRCDMAMLVLNEVFEKTWGMAASEDTPEEFWSEAMAAIRKEYPAFLMIAECYLDTEWHLQQLVFDYCYDKRLYDRLIQGSAESIRTHISAELDYQDKLIRFTENHDEVRANWAFDPVKGRAAAIIMASLPGAKLFHEGQFEGRKMRVPVFLRRRPDEIENKELAGFYLDVLKLVDDPVLRKGDWTLLDCKGWPENPSHQNLLAWAYRLDEEYRLIAVNYSPDTSQGIIKMPWDSLRGKSIYLNDAMHEQSYCRQGSELYDDGLFIELLPWAAHWFSFSSFRQTRKYSTRI